MNKIEEYLRGYTQKYHHKKYWSWREKVIDKEWKCPILLKLFYLYKIKKSDAFNNSSMGTSLHEGAFFKTPPNLPHGLYGIIVSRNAIIGENCTIFHQVTIGEGRGGAPIIGDNCYIGAGAKIIGNIMVGNNMKIGANCVVVEDIPDNCTVVLEKPRIVRRNN